MTQEVLKLALEALERINDRFDLESVAQDATKAITAIKEALAQPEFIKHEVESADDWSEWVCPDTKNYLMKCCDCGLVHEAQFGVVRYRSETEREDCDMVDDPNLQAVFRMRRSEQWSPEDTAHRAGGMPMAQPAQQEPVAWGMPSAAGGFVVDCITPKEHARIEGGYTVPLYTSPPAQRTWVGLKPEQVQFYAALHRQLEVVYYDATLDTNVITETFNATDFYQQVESELKELNK